MSASSVSLKSAPVPPLPTSGLVGLLQAMGLTAVQVAPEVVALRATPTKA